jgi:hypothetical protein
MNGGTLLHPAATIARKNPTDTAKRELAMNKYDRLIATSFREYHFLHISKLSNAKPIEIDAAGKSFPVERSLMLSCIEMLVNERRDLSS